MKKMISALLALVMALVCSACGAKEETPPAVIETQKEPPAIVETQEEKPSAVIDEKVEEPSAVTEETVEEPFAVIEAKDCFYDAGYIEFIAGAEVPGEYTFTAENSESVTWRVYVFDEAFDDGFRYISQAAEPMLAGDGTVSVGAGQFVYVYCSANEVTTGVINENAKLIVTVK